MRCPQCPVPEAVACDPARNPRRCHLAANNPAFLPVLRTLGEGHRSALRVAPTPIATAPRDSPTARIPVAESIALIRRSAACEHRGCKRGCSKWDCSRHGKVVALADCFACLKADDADSTPAQQK